MIRFFSLSAIASGLLLSACAQSPSQSQTQKVDVQAISIGDKAFRCIPASDLGMYPGSDELVGDLRSRLLTPEADRAGVRVYREGTSVTTFGSQTLYYTNAAATCILWSEGIGLQEYGQRLGLNPVGISPHYVVDKPKTTETKPTETTTK
jgi:hypothetical protein